jgi:hypothetical protein
LFLAAIVVLGLPVLAAAQSAAPVAGGIPLPTIGLPLPQIGLPHPATGLPVARSPQQPASTRPPAPRARRSHRATPYLVPVYVWPYLVDAAEAPAPHDSSGVAVAGPAQTSVGYLALDVADAGDAHLYVDGFYVGTLADFASGAALEAGPHALEIRAAGFETLSFAVNIVPGRTIAYRGLLKTIDARPAPDAAVATSQPAVPVTPMIGYIVPGCYIGNVPPQDAGLPASCDVSRAITIGR